MQNSTNVHDDDHRNGNQPPRGLTGREAAILDELRGRGYEVRRAMMDCRRERWQHTRAITQRQPEGGRVW